jgi:stearoyl-CoA desaturase (delta-9 desaturase)
MLHTYTPLVPTIKRTSNHDINKARAHVHRLQAERLTAGVPADEIAKHDHELPEMTLDEVMTGIAERGEALLLIDGFIVDVTDYLEDHVSPRSLPPRKSLHCWPRPISQQPGGANLLKTWSIRAQAGETLDMSRKAYKHKQHAKSPASIDSGYESTSGTSGSSSPTFDDQDSTFPSQEQVDVEKVQARLLKDATKPFFGQINNHSQAAKEKMRCLRVARLKTDEGVDIWCKRELDGIPRDGRNIDERIGYGL